MDVYLIRHGLTDFLKKGKIQMPDSPLNTHGKKQAMIVAKKSRFRNIDRVISSPWPRAKETAEIIAKELSKPYEVFRGIHEATAPSIYGEKHDGKVLKEFRKEYIKNINNLDWKFSEDGETLREVIKRVVSFQKHLVEKHSGESILVVSHGTLIRTFISIAMLGEKYNDKVFFRVFRSLKTDNTGISLLGYREKEKRWIVYYINDHAHLGELDKKRKKRSSKK